MQHYESDDTEAVHEDIIKALEEVNFGRNNYACRSCDSDIEPPVLYLRAMIELGYITNEEFAYLVYTMEYEGMHFTELVLDIKNKRENETKLELPEEANKYKDPKPMIVMERLGILTSERINGAKAMSVVPAIMSKYGNRLRNLKVYNIDKNSYEDLMDTQALTSSFQKEITPQWFQEHAVAFPTLDSEAEKFLNKFRMVFSPEKLKQLEGKSILDNLFLNPNNKTNLCYILEFDSDCRTIFGSIKSGTAYKYGLHYSQKNNSWATGTGRNPQFLTEDEAIELGTQIRDNLVAGAECIQEFGELENLEDYQSLYMDLFDITDGYINKVWFMKYYAMLFPKLFPPIYSTSAQTTVLNKVGLSIGDNLVYRSGQIKKYVDECNISNVLFSRIFWTFCNGDDEKKEEQEETETLKSCLEIVRQPRTEKTYPLNFIVYGAPGTGKTYSMVEYALAIINNILRNL